MAGFGFSDKIKDVTSYEGFKIENILGKGLLQPFNNTNAGARKIMFGTHKEHVFSLMRPEKAILETGYEIRFGDYSSSVTKADAKSFASTLS